ncbi:hypothetical protein TVAG_291600 [Trichomonas vaginalis G3]|uniref:DUF3447 domain-containing protein n=1 Tax=Trichomonas vaginalis (strain ATCC PRA-98 / G3) TaxID=412133 RepID=A2DQU1_TRIV3|nr:protein of unknown function (DUF3447) [Trichomonas vaginalis G3]EAY17208.1 hypothetical protein TVAG_291600 [Trichomonas vaginalis G3]KAI5486259.1 protein of unknown function (DUF3447) [Trichomonas vaginalis G3]|eukprot:XP_001329431.1 hypothetical protein [Trichomonas vaginalis G3]
MSEQDVDPSKYNQLRSICKYYIDSYLALYQLKTEKEEEIKSIYKMIKTELIDSKKYLPTNAIKDILDIIPYNNRYTKSYLYLAKLISDDYHITEVSSVATISNFLFYKEYGIKLDKSANFEKVNSKNLDIYTENTIYRAIMYNDKERFITFTESDEFDIDQRLKSNLYPDSYKGYSFLELCCYHGSVDCFKFLRTKFKSEITETCLEFSFLGGNTEIMSECLKYQKPDLWCMKYAIISHNIDFVTFLMNEYNIEIYLEYCGIYNNLESFLVYFDQINDIYKSLSEYYINKCFVYSAIFDVPSFLEYLLSHGTNINVKDKDGKTALHVASCYNRKETAEVLISHGANINEKTDNGITALYIAAEKIVKKLRNFLFHMVQISMKKIYMEKPHFILQQKITEKKLQKFLFRMVLMSMKKLIVEEPHFLLLLIIIGKKLRNFLFHMVLISMKKIYMDKLHFILQQKITEKKLQKFLFRMVRISMKKMKMEKPHFILQQKITEKKLQKF